MLSEKEFIQEIRQNENIIYKVCNRYMDNKADREDLFQEILLNAWKGITRYKGLSKFSTWLYRVALNTAITFYKKGKKNSMASGQANWFDSNSDIQDERIIAMNKAINELSGIDKALVMLYLEDYTYQGIADIMGITVNNVAVKMNRIKARLKENCKKYLS